MSVEETYSCVVEEYITAGHIPVKDMLFQMLNQSTLQLMEVIVMMTLYHTQSTHPYRMHHALGSASGA